MSSFQPRPPSIRQKTVALANGSTLNYERLVVSPGIAFKADAIGGTSTRPRMAAMPPAYNSGEEIIALRRQLEAMENGGTVVISSPVNPARCPPAPYERASLIAHYLKTRKPRSKGHHPRCQGQLHHAEAVRSGMAGALSRPDRMGRTVAGRRTDQRRCRNTKHSSTDFDKYQAAVASIIPPQIAGHAAELAGVADSHRLVPGRSASHSDPGCSPAFMLSATPPSPARCRVRLPPHIIASADLCRSDCSHPCRQQAGRADADIFLLQP